MNRKLLAVMLVTLVWGALAFCDEIHDAAAAGDLEKVKALLKANPDLVFSKNIPGETPLHLAALFDHKDVAALLLTNKAEVNTKCNRGSTPLHYAAKNGYKDVVQLLLVNQATVNVKDNNDMTPLDWAEKNDYADVVELLRQHGGQNTITANTNIVINHSLQGGIPETAKAEFKKHPELAFKN